MKNVFFTTKVDFILKKILSFAPDFDIFLSLLFRAGGKISFTDR